MKVKTWIPLVIAVVLGLVAAKLTRDSLAKGRAAKAEDKNRVTSIAAAQDIMPGQKLTAADVVTVEVAAEGVPAGSFQDPTQLIERVAITRMVKGQSILETMLAPKDTAAGVQALIPEGMRAITLQVNEFSGLAGLLMPGCKVDIISVIRNDQAEGSVARTIAQNVEVRAIGRQIVMASPPAAADLAAGAPPVPFVNNVTLLVTPQQAESLQLASVGGSPWLVLRNAKDATPYESAGTSMADLRGDKAVKDGIEVPTKVTSLDPFQEKPAAPTSVVETLKTRTIKFIRNGKEEAVQVDVAPQPPADWLKGPGPGAAASTQLEAGE